MNINIKESIKRLSDKIKTLSDEKVLISIKSFFDYGYSKNMQPEYHKLLVKDNSSDENRDFLEKLSIEAVNMDFVTNFKGINYNFVENLMDSML